MKKQYALLDINNEITDLMEVNEGEILATPDPGFHWEEIKSPSRDLMKDPEKFNINNNTANKKPEVRLTVSKTKARINDVLDIEVSTETGEPVTLNIDGQLIIANDKEKLSIQLVDEGVYKIFSEDRKFYCPVVFVEVK